MELSHLAGQVSIRQFPFGTRTQRFGGIEFDQFAQPEKAGAIRDAAGLLHVVGHNHDGVLPFEFGDEIFNLAGRDGVEGRGGFVEQDNLRAGSDGAPCKSVAADRERNSGRCVSVYP